MRAGLENHEGGSTMTLQNLWDRFEARPLRTRLVASLGLGAIVTVLVSVGSVFGIRWFATEMDRMFQRTAESVMHAQDAHLQLVKVRRSLGNLLLVSSDRSRSEARADLQIARDKLDRELAYTRAALTRPERIEQFAAMERQLRDYLYNIQRALALIDRNSPESTAFVLGPDVHDSKKRVEAAIDALVQGLLEDGKRDVQGTMEQARFVVLSLAVAALLGLLLGLFLARVLIRSVEAPNARLIKVVEDITGGRHEQPVPYLERNNETGQLARSLEVLRQSVFTAANENWIKDNSASVLAAIRGADSVDELARVVLSALAPMLGLGHGVFYRTDAAGQLTLAGTYAMTQRKRLQTTFEPGEGLPGQCLRERQPIHLILPSDHVTITSGLGDAPATQVIAWPVILGESVLGVMELATFSTLAVRHHQLLEVLSNPIASALQVLDRNQRTQELLTLAQTQSEQMQRQAAKLEEQAVEMEAQQAEMREADTWYRNIIDSLTHGILIVGPKGGVIAANPAAERLFGYEDGTLAGAMVHLLIPDGGRAALTAALASDGTNTDQAGATLRGRRSDGKEFRMRAWFASLPARDGHGRSVSVTITRLEGET